MSSSDRIGRNKEYLAWLLAQQLQTTPTNQVSLALAPPSVAAATVEWRLWQEHIQREQQTVALLNALENANTAATYPQQNLLVQPTVVKSTTRPPNVDTACDDDDWKKLAALPSSQTRAFSRGLEESALPLSLTGRDGQNDNVLHTNSGRASAEDDEFTMHYKGVPGLLSCNNVTFATHNPRQDLVSLKHFLLMEQNRIQGLHHQPSPAPTAVPWNVLHGGFTAAQSSFLAAQLVPSTPRPSQVNLPLSSLLSSGAVTTNPLREPMQQQQLQQQQLQAVERQVSIAGEDNYFQHLLQHLPLRGGSFVGEGNAERYANERMNMPPDFSVQDPEQDRARPFPLSRQQLRIDNELQFLLQQQQQKQQQSRFHLDVTPEPAAGSNVSNKMEEGGAAAVDSKTTTNSNKPTETSPRENKIESTRPTKPVSKVARRRVVKDKNKPKRPMSAYNFFFQLERSKLLKEIASQTTKPRESSDVSAVPLDAESPRQRTRKRRRNRGEPHGMITFEKLAKMIGTRWKEVRGKELAVFQKQAEQDLQRYKDEMKAYLNRKTPQSLQGDVVLQSEDLEMEIDHAEELSKEADGGGR